MEILEFAKAAFPQNFRFSRGSLTRLEGVVSYIISGSPDSWNDALSTSYGMYAEDKFGRHIISKTLNGWPSDHVYKMLEQFIIASPQIKKSFQSIANKVKNIFNDLSVSFKSTSEYMHEHIISGNGEVKTVERTRHTLFCYGNSVYTNAFVSHSILGSISDYINSISTDHIAEKLVQELEFSRQASRFEGPLDYSAIAVDSKLMGMIIHEAVGHALENDNVNKGASALDGKCDNKLFDSNINIYADPQIKNCAYTVMDSRGDRAEAFTCVKNGKITNMIGSVPGSDLAESYKERPLPRMTSIFFAPKKWFWRNRDLKDQNIIESAHRAGVWNENSKPLIYMSGWSGGVANWQDLTFNIDIRKLMLISRDGKVEKYKDAAFFGNALGFLNAFISAAGRLDVSSVGFCEKAGQKIMTSDGGPQICFFRPNNGSQLKPRGNKNAAE